MTMGLSLDNLRQGKGHYYYLRNYGEEITFEIMEMNPGNAHRIRDIYILEEYNLLDFIRYGIGNDFELIEVS